MMEEYDDDLFFEEDKMYVNNKYCVLCKDFLLQIIFRYHFVFYLVSFAVILVELCCVVWCIVL